MTASVVSHTEDSDPGQSFEPWQDGLARESLVVLSRDEALVEMLREVAPEHEIAVVGAEVDLPARLLGHRAGVALIDTGAVATPIGTLTERLKAQFPDIVLVVAGDAADQAALAAHVTRGIVYRFLHKPLSEQRVRLFLDAAWRRHGEELLAPAATVAEHDAAPRRTRSGVLIGAALAVAVIVGAWLFFRGEDPAGPAPAAGAGAAAPPSSATPDPRVEELLSRADAALARGALLEPPGDNAAALYGEALAIDAASVRARAGLEAVIDALLTRAEKALEAGDVNEAQRLTDAARAIRPDHVRVAFLTAQIGKERERELLARARQAAAAGDVDRAIAVLEGASRAGRGSPLMAETRAELEQELDARIQRLLSRAQERMQSGALLEPAQDNARFFVASAAALAPDHQDVRRMQRDLARRIAAAAQSALAARDVEAGERLIAAAADAGADADRIEALRREARSVRMAVEAEALAQLSQLFNQRLAEGRLLDPPADSARHYAARLAEAAPDHPSTRLARESLAARLLEEARRAAARQDGAGAQRWLAEARAEGAAAEEIAAVERELAADRAAPQRQEPLAASALQLVRSVSPEYPLQARERGITGWVDVEFTVKTDGGVTDVRVVEAEPERVFDRAAVDAVRKWRYRPATENGVPVERRARVRIQFRLE